jgi:acyl carrier protein
VACAEADLGDRSWPGLAPRHPAAWHAKLGHRAGGQRINRRQPFASSGGPAIRGGTTRQDTTGNAKPPELRQNAKSFFYPPNRRFTVKPFMTILQDIVDVLDGVLNLGGKSRTISRVTPMLGAMPQFDSMTVVVLIDAIESRFGICIEDTEIAGETFATVGTLTDFVATKLKH